MNETPELCTGCSKWTGRGPYGCGVYYRQPSYFVRQGQCPFNPPKVEVKKTFVNPLKASKRSKGK